MQFLNKKYKQRRSFLEKNAKSVDSGRFQELDKNFFEMNEAGVKDEKSFKDYFYISSNVEIVGKELLGRNLTEKEKIIISKNIFQNINKNPINTIVNFYKSADQAIDSLGLKKPFSIKKIAYPQVFDDFYVQTAHNMNRWLEATRQIYALKAKGFGLSEATSAVIKEWDNMEQNDFKNWLKFYQSGQDKSYKTARTKVAQFYVGDGVNIGSLKAQLPGIPGLVDSNFEKEQQKQREYDFKTNLAKKRNALLGRLNSAERIMATLPTDEFKKIFGTEQEAIAWLEKLHELKRKISIIRNASTIQDMIILSGNQLRSSGFIKSANLMMKIAQAAPPAVDAPMPDLGGMEGLGDLGQPVEPAPVDITVSNDAGEDEEKEDLNDPEGAMKIFIESLIGDDSSSVDDMKISSFDDFDGAIIIISEDEEINKTAQAAPANPAQPIQPVQPEPVTEIKETEEEIKIEPENAKVEVFEKKIDKAQEGATIVGDPNLIDEAIESALSNISYKDIIIKLEGLATLFKQRQVVRELTVVDLMMQAVGVASFFPSLAEATKSALDSNQYVLTRIEDILAKLRGATGLSDGSLDGLKDKLIDSDTKAENRKIQREKENMSGPVEEVDLSKELTQGPVKSEENPAVTLEQMPVKEQPVAPVQNPVEVK